MPIAGCVIVALTLLYANDQHLVLRDLPQQQPNNKQNKATASRHKNITTPPLHPKRKRKTTTSLFQDHHASTVRNSRLNIQAGQRHRGMDIK